MEKIISHFDRFDAVPTDISFHDAMEAIRTGKYYDPIIQLRQAKDKGETVLLENLKKQLPSFSFCGCFEGRRKMDHLKHYLPIIGLDIDKVGEVEAIQLREKVKTDPLILAAFISPSGTGLKVFIKHSGNQSDHKRAFEEVSAYFRNKYQVVLDEVVKDITRLCFYSFDPDLIYNPGCETFLLSAIPGALPVIKPSIDVFQAGLDRLDMTSNYTIGRRNNFIYRLACWCNRGGLSMEECADQCLAVFDLDEKEIVNTVKSAYQPHQHEHGKFKGIIGDTKDANYAMQTKKEEDDQDIPYSYFNDALANTPYLINFDEADLLELIRKSVEVFDDKREKDVMLISAITVLSACFYNTSGIYRKRQVWPNLYSFIVAPPAFGKGAMDFAMQLVGDFNDKLLKTSEEAREKYTAELEQYKQLNKDEKVALPRTLWFEV